MQEDLHQPPVLTKKWFHTGAFLDREKILGQFAHEYSRNNLHPENLLPEPELPAGLSIDEWRQALRACKGTMLRKEVYALDNTPLSDKPYTVEQQNCLIRIIQPQLANKHACFIALSSESISYYYERDPADPRVAHTFVLEADEFANVRKSASLSYKRKIPAFPEQGIVHATYSENDFTNSIDSSTDHRTPVLFQTKLYELTGLAAPASNYYTLQELKTACLAAASIDYNVQPNGSLQKRLVEWYRLQFTANDGLAALKFGTLQSKALVRQVFKAAFNEAGLTDVFSPKIPFAELRAVLLNPSKRRICFCRQLLLAAFGKHAIRSC